MNWAPEITPLTFDAKELQDRPSWHGHIKSKVICFLASVRKKGAVPTMEYRLRQLCMQLCEVMKWHDLSVEIDQIVEKISFKK